ncbi:hypothetical protein SPRG_16891 [Saprolegnia parasitica CBS 223.65]|uniref:Uncharacterized protein n=1 Tax=Saprolegnia parasitica (strain CBS 223.65) TaxID=695850 RepID=A0A067BHV6_SAPPC|nr:hypothetical protein SPRG_16891 [Saprolegnia parasitica CBS 223.65]KDO17718.1 hypothetical protein SPRG_16891 [Saprolegnia parasitica CBS 223.65]|eukprot:XP_012211577.1 hypothetical protein SPRG_16891 [Saprolegnia parasitica CBS 223.65]
MAVLPPTYLGAVIVLFVLFRLRHIVSLTTLLMHRVSYFLPPSNAVLEALNTPPPPKKAKTPKPEKTATERLEAMKLHMTPIETGTLSHCLYFDLLDTMVLLGASAMVVFWIQQGADASAPDASYYMLVVALLLSVLFPVHVKFGHGVFGSYEARLGLGIGGLALVVACFCIYTPAGVFDFDVDGASSSLEYRVQRVLAAVAGNATTPAPPTRSVSLYLGGSLGLLAGVITSTQFLPALRFARMYLDFISSRAIRTRWKLVLHLNQLLPLLVAATFVRPFYAPLLSGAIVCDSADTTVFATAPRDCGDAWMKESMFRDGRLSLVVFTALVRLACFRSHLQYFLLEPKGIITGMLLQRGRIDTSALVDKLVVPFSYIPVVALQYLAPCLTYVSAAMLLQRKAGRCFHWMAWLDVVGVDASLVACDAATAPVASVPAFFLTAGTDLDLRTIVTGLQSYPIALPQVFETILGFVVFWTAFSWFGVSVTGLLYWRRVGTRQSSVEQEDVVTKHMKRKPKTM